MDEEALLLLLFIVCKQQAVILKEKNKVIWPFRLGRCSCHINICPAALLALVCRKLFPSKH